MNAIEDAMSQMVTMMWEAMIGPDIQPVDVPVDDDSMEPLIVGYVHVVGPEGGVVTLECSEALGRETAAVIFQMPLTQVGLEEAHDALGELTNIIGGNFKALLSEGHQLSLPTVVEGPDFRTTFSDKQPVARVGFACGGGERLVASFFRDGSSTSVDADDHSDRTANA